MLNVNFQARLDCSAPEFHPEITIALNIVILSTAYDLFHMHDIWLEFYQCEHC